MFVLNQTIRLSQFLVEQVSAKEGLKVAGFSLVLALGFGFFPIKAFSGTIAFFGANLTDMDRCIACTNLFSGNIICLRRGFGAVPPNSQGLHFYSAEINWCPPYGEWTCNSSLGGASAIGCDNGGTVSSVDFDLESPTNVVGVVINTDATMFVTLEDKAGSSLAAAAHLGDDPKPSDPDRDTFSFNGTQGDEVTLRVEEDPSAGHLGEQATLILRDAISGASLNEVNTGAVPLEIKTTLPATGEYTIVVQQHDISRDIRFRGDYNLSLLSTPGDVESMVPADDVEK